MKVKLFAGQGRGHASASELVASRRPDLHGRVRELVGQDAFERPPDDTAAAQPVLFCAALCLDDAEDADIYLGHSLGEYAALVSAGAVSERDALEVVVLRGRLMQEACEHASPSSMVAVSGRALADLDRVAIRLGLFLANDNGPTQKVYAGEHEAVGHLATATIAEGARADVLDVAGAFHTPLMDRAARLLRRRLERVAFSKAAERAVSGLTGRPYRDPAIELAEAMRCPVRFADAVRWTLSQGADDFREIALAPTLAPLVRRISRVSHEHGPTVAGVGR